MSLNIYDYCQMPDRGMVIPFGILLKRRFSVFLDVFGCLKLFRVGFSRFFVWSFSMLWGLEFVVVVSPVERHYILGYVDGVKNVD